jgi:hypothetical protein
MGAPSLSVVARWRAISVLWSQVIDRTERVSHVG